MQAEVEDNWKQLSLEFVVTFAENGTTYYFQLISLFYFIFVITPSHV